ncbi:hypothetical protein B7L58_13315 [Escherichia coli]|nr:hypothetical protein [Escherichia coli]PLK00863.1 hypothetical protein B7L58_13315 [Escherichia coli]PSZ43496.1 hypothetical protein C7B00_01695 [Escherichia coli]RCO11488.1 hypothetical protein BEA14_22805 [Escherichia coli]
MVPRWSFSAARKYLFMTAHSRQYLLIIQLLNSENMHKLAFFLCRWDEPDSFVKSGKFLQRRMVRI